MTDIPKTEFGTIVPAPGLAYGVDPRRSSLYSLRQSRYQAIAADVDDLVAKRAGPEPFRVLDVGVDEGVLKRYLDAWPAARAAEMSGVDVVLRPTIYRRDEWAKLWEGDLMGGLPDVPSDMFDVVVCEQVLEHLPRLETAIATLERVLKPGGLLFVGVPIFPPGLDLIRRHVVPVVDRVFQPSRVRGHVQAFTRLSFVDTLRRNARLDILTQRGFRIISGGLLRPLESTRGWWRLNRWLGERVPGLCVELQVVARKPAATPPRSAAGGGSAPARD